MKKIGKKIGENTKKNYKKLYTALIDLMESKSFDDISVVDICEKSGIPRATFYNHFEDKFDLLRYFFNSKIAGLIEELKQKKLNGKELIDDLIYEVLLFITKNSSLLERMLREDNGIGIFEIEKIINNVLLMNFKNLQKDYDFTVPIPPLAAFYAGALVFAGKWWIDSKLSIGYSEVTILLKKLLDPKIYTLKKKV